MAIDDTSLTKLRTRFRGALLQPDEEGYEEARRVWNGAVDRRPASSPGARDRTTSPRLSASPASSTSRRRFAVAATRSVGSPSVTVG